MATHASDPVTVTVTSIPGATVASDPMIFGAAPVASALVPASGSTAAATVVISFELD